MIETLKAVLYEFLPFTYQDIRYGRKWISRNSMQLVALVYPIKYPTLHSLNIMPWYSALKLVLWITAWQLFVYIEFGSFFIVMTGICLIFLNLGEKRDPSELSAYSVFNRGQKRLPGTMTAEQFEHEIRHNYNHED